MLAPRGNLWTPFFVMFATLNASQARVGTPTKGNVRRLSYTATSRIGNANIPKSRQQKPMGSLKTKNRRYLEDEMTEDIGGGDTNSTSTSISNSNSYMSSIDADGTTATHGKMSSQTKSSKRSKSATYEPTYFPTETSEPTITPSFPSNQPTPRPTRRPTRRPTPSPTIPEATPAPTENGSTPGPSSAATSIPTATTSAPSSATSGPTATLAPSIVRGSTLAPFETAVPSTALGCTDNPQDYAINIDIQIDFAGASSVCTSDEDNAIAAAIQAALTDNFATAVPDWNGDANFGEFTFDPTQEARSGDDGRQLMLTGRLLPHRRLQQGTCSERSVDCNGDTCRFGCLAVSTTDCGTSVLTNWGALDEPVLDSLTGLGFSCLGNPQQLEVILVVVEVPEVGTPTSTPAPSPTTAGPTSNSTPGPSASTPVPTLNSTPGPSASTPVPTPNSTPAPTATTPVPTSSSTSAPSASTPGPTSVPTTTATSSGTPAPSSAATSFPTPPLTCTDNPQEYTVNIDLQIDFAGASLACTPGEDNTVAAGIQAALNNNFATTVPDWDGDAFWGPFVFDPTQEARSGDNQRNLQFDRELLIGRRLQQGSCTERFVDCQGDVCRWGCITAATTDCGTSSITNWGGLDEVVRDSLAGLGLSCLGNPQQLEVIFVVEDPEAEARGEVQKTVRPDESTSVLDPNQILLQSEGGAGASVADRITRVVHIESRLKIRFFAGYEKDPSQADIDGLIPQISAFLTDRMKKDPLFALPAADSSRTGISVVSSVEVKVSDVSHKRYLRDADTNTDTFQLDLAVYVNLTADSQLTVPQVAKALTEYDFKYFIRDYAWKSEPYKQNLFYHTEWVKFITKKGQN